MKASTYNLEIIKFNCFLLYSLDEMVRYKRSYSNSFLLQRYRKISIDCIGNKFYFQMFTIKNHTSHAFSCLITYTYICVIICLKNGWLKWNYRKEILLNVSKFSFPPDRLLITYFQSPHFRIQQSSSEWYTKLLLLTNHFDQTSFMWNLCLSLWWNPLYFKESKVVMCFCNTEGHIFCFHIFISTEEGIYIVLETVHVVILLFFYSY